MTGQRYSSLDHMISAHAFGAGPIAVIVVEDEVEVETTLRHHLNLAFEDVVALMPDRLPLAADLAKDVIRACYDTAQADALPSAINRLMDALDGRWIYCCYNAEYLFFPFCESRSVGEMVRFHSEERRDAMLAYTVDLYADDLTASPDAVCLETAHLDRAGYYALARAGPDGPKERQLDFFGGLRWRFEEHVPENRRKIDRVPLFRAQRGLRLRWDHTFEEEELNTYACPWHHNITAAICSFRTAKALRRNPGSRAQIDSFGWPNSVPFTWQSQQLLDLGLIEPGQWF
ncbi:MAG: hypothetical protein AAF943_09640 [Pseudomonadota bacterium]